MDTMQLGTGFGASTIMLGGGLAYARNMKEFKKQSTDAQNYITRNLYMQQLYEMAISRIEFIGIEEESINVRYMIKTFLERGSIIVFRDEDLGLLALPFTGSGFDIYGEILDRNAIGLQGYHNDNLNKENSVIGYNTLSRTNFTLPVLSFYTDKICECVRQYDVNMGLLNQSPIIFCDQDSLETAKQFNKQNQNHEAVIYAQENKGFEPKYVQPDIKDNTASILERKSYWWKESLNFLGIENNTDIKKERMISGEVESSLGDTIAARFSTLESLQTFCKQVNDMFGTNWSVRFKGNLSSANDGSNYEQVGDSNITESEVDNG